MNIIICGAGRVGFTIAKQLSEQGHSITVIDQSSVDIQKIDETLDVKAIVGKATYPSILEKANASETDMIIAVTRNDEINMVICQIAFSIFNIPKKIARIRSQDYLNPKFTTVYNKENLPIDVIISPELEIAKSIQRKLEAPGALDSVPFADNKIRLLEILINDNCNLINIKLNELTKKHPNLDANIIGVIRGEKFLIPKKNDEIKKDDKIYVIINSSQMSQTLEVFGHNEKVSKKILIVGGGNIGFNLAKNLEESLDTVRVKIVEKNKDRSEFLANELNNTIVINGDALDEEVLVEANLEEAETVLALTNDDEDNLMVSVLVEKFAKDDKKIDDKRTMALINKPNYSLLQNSLKIDDLIDPRMNTVSSILKHIHKGTIETAYTILNGEYEVIEAEIIETSELINKELKNSNLPEEIRIGAVLRDNKVVIPRSNFVFQKDDKAYIAINASQMQDTLSAFGHNEKIYNKILIIGGGNIGFNLAKNLEETFDSARVKIIEKDKERAEFIASELNNTIIINGNGLDEEVLIEANLDEVQTVLALTNDDEDNLMVSVLVEKFTKDKDDLNDKRTMALINKPNYSLLQNSLKIDDLIDPRMNTVSSILKHVHKGTIETAYTILNGEYEVIEAEIIETSELINKELKNSNLPEEIRIGAILRQDKVIIPRSNFIFKKDDRVVFLARKDSISVVENIFRISSI